MKTTKSMQSNERRGNPATAGRGPGMARTLPGDAAGLVHAQIVAAAADLERLLLLLEQAGGDLMHRFAEFDRLVGEISREAAGSAIARRAAALQESLLGATTAMQFQDMSTQLVEHALSELRILAHRLGDVAGLQEGREAVGARRSPVSQSGMGAGSIDLF